LKKFIQTNLKKNKYSEFVDLMKMLLIELKKNKKRKTIMEKKEEEDED
jgi:hypothetical protein